MMTEFSIFWWSPPDIQTHLKSFM